MRILINDTLEKQSFWMPWDSDATCYNFKFPEETILPDKLDTIEDKYAVKTLVIKCDLPDYRFISEMKNLTQLYIYTGNNISDLSFLEDLVKLQQILIVGTHIASLESLVKLIKAKKKLYDEMPDNSMQKIFIKIDGVCIQSDGYIGDGSELIMQNICSTEIIVNKNTISFRNIRKIPKYKQLLDESDKA